MKLSIRSVNISKEKGTVKVPVKEITLDHQGVVGDAHSGDWHRQGSLLGKESIDRFIKATSRHVTYGAFAENLTTEGIALAKTSPLDRFSGEETELEVTQIGKSCHGSGCAIFHETGQCVMPKEGIFARVIRQGTLRPGDILTYKHRIFRFHVVTLSDRASSGVYSDRSGPRIIELLHDFFRNKPRQTEVRHTVIPDDSSALRILIGKLVNDSVDVIITTGGTGIGPRDITVETVRPLLDKEIPGIMEMIRIKYGQANPNALLSRGVAGMISESLIYTLPGSVKAVQEYMAETVKTMEHLIYMRHGLNIH